MKVYSIALIAFTGMLFVACSSNQRQTAGGPNHEPHSGMTSPVKEASANEGRIVPNNEVCMVNDKYMGEKQLEILHHGKSYYGCCEMCRNRIPLEKEARIAIDPVSHKEVDKAIAVIAVSGEDGEVSYFENKQNYETFFSQHD